MVDHVLPFHSLFLQSENSYWRIHVNAMSCGEPSQGRQEPRVSCRPFPPARGEFRRVRKRQAAVVVTAYSGGGTPYAVGRAWQSAVDY
jgi:hypothetical protein